MSQLPPLHDIELPKAIGAWPLAPGWYFVILLAIGLSILLVYYLRHLWRKNCIKRAALRECYKLEKRYEATNENICAGLSVLLRRTTLAFHPAKQTTLIENDWIAFLNSTQRRVVFPEELAELLITSPYQRNAPPQTPELLAATREWIKRQG